MRKLILFIFIVLISSPSHGAILWEDDFNGYTSGWTPSVGGQSTTFYPWTTDQTFDPTNPAADGGGSVISNYEPSAYAANLRTNANSWNGWVQYPDSTGTISIQTTGGVDNSPALRFRIVKYTGLSNELGIHKWLGNTNYQQIVVEYKIKFGTTGDDFWWDGEWDENGNPGSGGVGIIWKLGRVWTGFNPTDYDKTGGQTQPVENTTWTDESNWRSGIWIWGVMADEYNLAKWSTFFYLADFYWSPTCPDGGAGTCDSQNAPRGGLNYWEWKRYTDNLVPLTSYGRLNTWTNSGNAFDSDGSFLEAQTFHTIRILFKNRSTPTTDDGDFRMWIDGNEITNDTSIAPAVQASMSLDADDYGINFVRFGDNFNNLTTHIPASPGYMDVWIDGIRIGETLEDLDSAPTYDAPIVEILTASQSTTSATITIIGTLTTDSELTGSGVDVNGVAATADDGTFDEVSEAWTALGVSLSLGANTITATGTDSEAETDTDTVSITRTEPTSTTRIHGAAVLKGAVIHQ